MKHTKKRAILSAVAMLVVSAIALSSATYAWFAASDNVAVDQLSTKVTASAGAILVSADNNQTDDWDTKLTISDIAGVASNVLPAGLVAGTSELKPVSISFADNTKKYGTLAQDETDNKIKFNSVDESIAGGTNTTGRYINYKVWLKYDATSGTKTVTVDPTFTSIIPYTYAATVYSSTPIVYGSSTTGYKPVITNVVAKEDVNGNGIMDAGEIAPALLGTLIETDNTDTFTIVLTAGVPQSFDVYIWAEGQDPACTGGAAAQGSFNFDMEITS